MRRREPGQGAVTITVPGDPIRGQLANLLAAGIGFDDAARKVVEPYEPSPAVDLMWPAVRRLAHSLERQRDRRVEDRAFGPGVGRRARHKAQMQVSEVRFRTGRRNEDGTPEVVGWGAASVQQHRARIAWQMTLRARIGVDIARHEYAVEVLVERGVDRLDEIGDWVSLPGWSEIGTPGEDDASGEVMAA